MNTLLKPLNRGILIAVWTLLLLIPTMGFAAQQWVVAEVFTATTCGFCPSARSALNQMNRNQEQFPFLIPIIWQSDAAHASPNYTTRRTLYGFTGIPHARFCGNVAVGGGGANVYNAYVNAYNQTVTRNSPMEMNVVVTLNAQNQMVVTADVEMTANINTPNTKVIFVLTYDLTGIMDPDYFASAKTYTEVDFTLTQVGQRETFVRNYNLDPSWELERLKAVVFVQSLAQANPIIHQGARGWLGQFEPVDVSGRVVGSNAPNGLVGATVRMSGAGNNFQVQTGANGNFLLEDVLGNEQGVPYELRVSYEGYETHISNREVFAQNLNLGNITLHQSIYTSVTGRIIGNDLPEGLADVTVQLNREAVNYDVQTGADGRFTFPQVRTTAQGVSYRLVAFKEGYSEHASDRDIAGEPVNLGNIQLDEETYPVSGVVATVTEEGDAVDLIWNYPSPVSGTEQWLHWDSGLNNSAIGTNAAAQFSVASRFTPAILEELDATGLFITSVKFFPNVQGATYTIKVWRGGSAGPLNAGQEVGSQAATNPTIGQWNEVILNSPVQILPEQEIWFGYHINTPSGHPAGCDAGPRVHNFGNVMHFGNEWTTMYDLNAQLNFNWNLQAYAGFTRGDRSISLNPNTANHTIDNDSYVANDMFDHDAQLSAVTTNYPAEDALVNSRTRSYSGRDSRQDSHRLLEGYAIYRLRTEDQDDPELWTFVDTADDTTYTDTTWGMQLPAGRYTYAILAEYTNEVFSTPAFSNEVLNRMHSTVEVNMTSNSSDPVTGAIVTLTNNDGNPDHVYTEEVPASGEIGIQNVWKGTYTVTARHTAYNRFTLENFEINDDNQPLQIELIENLKQIVDLNYEVYNNNNVRLTWQLPGTILGTPQWLHWDSGVHNGNVGTNSAAQFMCASRFSTQNIQQLNVADLILTSIKFYPNVATATYTLKVWKGGTLNPAINPGAEVHSQLVTDFAAGEWNTIQLTEPVLIEADQELWFGYHVNTPSGNPSGADAGPAVNYFGNLMYFNNAWTTLLALGATLNFNWNLQAYAGTEDDLNLVEVSSERLRSANEERDQVGERALSGYKIMRNDTLLEEDFQNLVYVDRSLPIGNYTYRVIAQYTTGESEPVATAEIRILDIDDDTEMIPLVTELQGNYPNPFNPDTKISFSLAADDLVQIEVFNLKGQMVRTLVNENMETGHHTVIWDGRNDNKADVGSGIYFYRMKSGSYSTTRKMILMK